MVEDYHQGWGNPPQVCISFHLPNLIDEGWELQSECAVVDSKCAYDLHACGFMNLFLFKKK